MSIPIHKKERNIPKSTNLGRNVKFLRRMNGHSQEELAKALGMNRSNIASYESGVVEPKATNFLKLCRFFKVEPQVLLQNVMSEEPKEVIAPGVVPDSQIDKYILDHIDSFTVQTNKMTKILEGYKAFYALQKSMDADHASNPLYGTLDQILELLQTLVITNWKMIQAFHPSSEEE